MSEKNNIFLLSFGAGLEYYDFTIYALLTPYIGSLFFASSSVFITTIITLLVFAIGYFARPIGGIFFGYLGDKYGRKKTLLQIMILMASSTFIMGILPSSKVGGEYMGIIFVLLRFLQGFSYGADLPCTVTIISEYSKRNSRGFHCGILTSFVSIGILIGSGLVFLLVHFLNKESMLLWGWRIPFLFGGVIAIVAYFIRKKAKEPQCFVKEVMKNNILNHPTFYLFRNYYKHLILGIGILLFPSFFILFFLVLPGYLKNIYQQNTSYIYLSTMIAYASTILTLPFFGIISDKIGRRRCMIITLFIFLISGTFLFQLIAKNGFVSIFIFMLIYQLFVSAMAGNYYPFLAELFPTNIRYSGVSICYNLSFAIAAISPVIVAIIFKRFGNIFSISSVFIVVAFISIIACILSKGYNEYIQE